MMCQDMVKIPVYQSLYELVSPNAAYMRQWIISISSDNGLAPIRRQVIIWTNGGLISIGPLGANCKKNQNTKFFIHENAHENVVCQNDDHFVGGGGGVIAIIFVKHHGL